MFRFPLPVAFAQLTAIRELDGVEFKGATWAERHAASALQTEQRRLIKLYSATAAP